MYRHSGHPIEHAGQHTTQPAHDPPSLCQLSFRRPVPDLPRDPADVYRLPTVVFRCVEYLSCVAPNRLEDMPFSSRSFAQVANGHPMLLDHSPDIRDVANRKVDTEKYSYLNIFPQRADMYSEDCRARVGNLLIWYLHQKWKPILPPDIVTAPLNSGYQLPKLSDNFCALITQNKGPTQKYLLLSRLLAFLGNMASRSPPSISGRKVMAQTFLQIIGLKEDLAEAMIRESATLFPDFRRLIQVGNKNQFIIEDVERDK